MATPRMSLPFCSRAKDAARAPEVAPLEPWEVGMLLLLLLLLVGVVLAAARAGPPKRRLVAARGNKGVFATVLSSAEASRWEDCAWQGRPCCWACAGRLRRGQLPRLCLCNVVCNMCSTPAPGPLHAPAYVCVP
jgi:hypothetical protein